MTASRVEYQDVFCLGGAGSVRATVSCWFRWREPWSSTFLVASVYKYKVPSVPPHQPPHPGGGGALTCQGAGLHFRSCSLCSVAGRRGHGKDVSAFF